MNAIVQTKRVLPEERAKIQNQVTRKTVAIGMITDESIYPQYYCDPWPFPRSGDYESIAEFSEGQGQNDTTSPD